MFQRGDTMTFDRNAYMREYTKKKYKRVPLDIPYEDYDRLKAHAEKNQESVNGFIKRAIRETMERDKHNI